MKSFLLVTDHGNVSKRYKLGNLNWVAKQLIEFVQLNWVGFRFGLII
jgi:hypothetical protein